MAAWAIDSLPGYRRRFVITPGEGWVLSALEDDFHCMAVLIRHDGTVATAVEPQMERAPWTTCPGAVEQLKQTFTGVRLDDFPERGEKQQNCTHLHDLALLAGAHASDSQSLVYDILVSDPIDGLIRTELRRNGTSVMAWTLEDMTIVAPAELAGQRLDALSPWIKTLDPVRQEEAKVLRWGSMIAHGRTKINRMRRACRPIALPSSRIAPPSRCGSAKSAISARDKRNRWTGSLVIPLLFRLRPMRRNHPV